MWSSMCKPPSNSSLYYWLSVGIKMLTSYSNIFGICYFSTWIARVFIFHLILQALESCPLFPSCSAIGGVEHVLLCSFSLSSLTSSTWNHRSVLLHFASQNLILKTSTVFPHISWNKNHFQTTSQDKHAKKKKAVDKNQFQIKESAQQDRKRVRTGFHSWLLFHQSSRWHLKLFSHKLTKHSLRLQEC